MRCRQSRKIVLQVEGIHSVEAGEVVGRTEETSLTSWPSLFDVRRHKYRNCASDAQIPLPVIKAHKSLALCHPQPAHLGQTPAILVGISKRSSATDGERVLPLGSEDASVRINHIVLSD
jgi:hypothetical protein